MTRVKRRRSHASTEVGTRTIATARAQAASGGAHAGEGACSGNGAVPPASAAHRSTDDNGSSANARENDAQIAEGCSPPTPSEASKVCGSSRDVKESNFEAAALEFPALTTKVMVA